MEEQYDQTMGPEMNWTCGFSPQGPLECLREATFHGFTVNGSEIVSMMASCDEHRENMKAHFKHPMDTPCGVAGSYFKWPENYCYLDWENELKGMMANVLTSTPGYELLAGAGGIHELTETAIQLTWKEDDSPWSNFTVTKKKRSVASETETFSGVASVPESPLLRLPITSETKPQETYTSSPQQRKEIVWIGKKSLSREVLARWLSPLSQEPSLSILGTTSESTERYPELSLSSMSNELSDPETGLETLSTFLNKTIGSFFLQHPEIHGLTIFPSSSPTDSIVLEQSSNKNTLSTSPTSSSPKSDDTETSEDLSSSEDKS